MAKRKSPFTKPSVVDDLILSDRKVILSRMAKCSLAGDKIIHETVESASDHCNMLKLLNPVHSYLFYECEHSEGQPHYHVATTNASVGSLLRRDILSSRVKHSSPPHLQGGLMNMLVQIIRRLRAHGGMVFVPVETGLKMQYWHGHGHGLKSQLSEHDDCIVTKIFYSGQNALLSETLADLSSTAIAATIIHEEKPIGVLVIAYKECRKASMLDLVRLQEFTKEISPVLWKIKNSLQN